MTFPAALEGRVIERVPHWRAKFEMCTQEDSCKRGSIDQWIVKLSLTQSRTANSAGSEIVLVHPTDTITAAVPPEAVPQIGSQLGLADCLQANYSFYGLCESWLLGPGNAQRSSSGSQSTESVISTVRPAYTLIC